EETIMNDATAAAAIYARIIAIDPDSDDALANRARLLLATNAFEGAAEAIATRRDRLQGTPRFVLDLELAALYIDRLDRPDDALDAAAHVLDVMPTDVAALRIVELALQRPDTRLRAAHLLERAADVSEEPEISARLLQTLLSASVDAPEIADMRHDWFER